MGLSYLGQLWPLIINDHMNSIGIDCKKKNTIDLNTNKNLYDILPMSNTCSQKTLLPKYLCDMNMDVYRKL